MANKVKGITVEIGGDTTKLGAALEDVDKSSRELQSELKGVNALLKFDPSNVDLLKQKQDILNETIETTKKRLQTLRDAQSDVTAQFERGDIGADAYRDFQREVIVTEQKLQGLEKQLQEMDGSGEGVAEVTGDMEELGENSDVASDGIQGVNDRLSAGLYMDAAEQLSGVADKLIEIGGNAIEAAMGIQDSQVILQSTLGLTNDEATELNGVMKNVFSNGVVESVEDANAAVQSTYSSFGYLNATELTDLTNQIVTLAKRTGTDVPDNVRAATQVMNAFNITEAEAFDLMAAGFQNGLNSSGDFLDSLNEYSPHFAAAGFSAGDMLQIIQNGMQNGAMNTDKAADAVKELQIRMGDGSFEEIVGSFSTGTQDLFQRWKNGEATVSDVATSISGDLSKMTPTEQQAALSLLSSQFEDLGVEGAAALFNVGDAFTDVSGKAEEMSEKTPSEDWQSSLRGLQEALIPIGEALIAALTPVLDVFAKFGQWFSDLPDPVINFITIFGGLIAVVGTLAPIIATLTVAFMMLNVPLLPIIGIIAGIAAAITAAIFVFKNWGAITDWLSEKWNQFKEWIIPIVTSMLDGINEAFSAAGEWIKGIWQAIPEFFSGIWTSITESATSVWTSITEAWNAAVEYIKSIWTGITTFFTELWTSITETAAMAWQAIIDTIMVVLSPFIETFQTIWSNIDTHISRIWTSIQTIATSAWEIIKNIILAPVLMIVDLVTGDFDNMGSHISQIWINIQTAATNIWNAIKDGINAIVGVLVGTLSVLWDNLKNNTSAIFNTVKDTAINLWNALKDGVINGANALKDGAINAWNNLKSSVINAATGLKDGAVNAWNSLKSSVVNAANGLKDGAVSAWNNLKSSVMNLANGAKDGAVNAWNSLKSMTSNIFNNVVSSIKSILNIDLYSVGKNIIQGLINGIKGMIGSVASAISEVAGNIKNKITSALGIHSPSRWMRDMVGKMIPAGIAVGVKQATPEVTESIDTMANDLKDSSSSGMVQMMNGKPIVNAQSNPLNGGLSAVDILGAKVDDMIAIMAEYLPNLNNDKFVVMDTGAVVGQLEGGINRAQATQYNLNKRGR